MEIAWNENVKNRGYSRAISAFSEDNTNIPPKISQIIFPKSDISTLSLIIIESIYLITIQVLYLRNEHFNYQLKQLVSIELS